jgi:hypothetical protein
MPLAALPRRAVVYETDACDDETSNSQKVRVQKKAAQEA